MPDDDAVLDVILPAGYTVVNPPPDYVSPSESARSQLINDYRLPQEIPGIRELQFFKESDARYFALLSTPETENINDIKHRRALRLLLRIKNGTSGVRKQALRNLRQEVAVIGSEIVIPVILDLLKDPLIDISERHLLCKTISRLMTLVEASEVEPFSHDIFSAILPGLSASDRIVRIEARELVAQFVRLLGLRAVLKPLRQDFESDDDKVRRTTAVALAVIAQVVGLDTLLPLFQALCLTRKGWAPRLLGYRAISELAQQVGSAILPYLPSLTILLPEALGDEKPRIRISAAQSIVSLANAANPFGIEAFEKVIPPLWAGIKRARGRVLASFLRAIGSLVPLVDPENSKDFVSMLLDAVSRQFESEDRDISRASIEVFMKCLSVATLIPESIAITFIRKFWVRRIALDQQMSILVRNATLDLSRCARNTLANVIDTNALLDPSKPFQKLALETLGRFDAVAFLDVSDITANRLMAGLLSAVAASAGANPSLLRATANVLQNIGSQRVSESIGSFTEVALKGIASPAPAKRVESAELGGIISSVAVQSSIGPILYEQLGEEYPEVLAAIIRALTSVVRSAPSLVDLRPPVGDLLPRLTPILRNRNEEVQHETVKLVDIIAEQGSEFVNAREWMRISFELLELMKSPRKAVQRAANATLGHISEGIGPQDVLAMLLQNLRAPERQSRVSTAVAIGMVADTCGPFTVIPALMNEYRSPDLNVQHGTLKALSFLFEYIGPGAREYVWSVVPIVDHALTDRNQVHRQIAGDLVKHIALGCIGSGYEDVFIHFLNELHPSIFESSPHLITRIMEAIDAIRITVGTGAMLGYIWAGLFHPARKVRTTYWNMFNAAYVQNSDAIVPSYPITAPEVDEWF